MGTKKDKEEAPQSNLWAYLVQVKLGLEELIQVNIMTLQVTSRDSVVLFELDCRLFILKLSEQT